MAQSTQAYKRSVSGSIGAGLSSVFGGGGRTYYVLEHKVSSKYHHAGEAQEIIVDQIEIGRDSKCQVQFDESFKTVSRRHAAIVRDGENWKLIQLSQTNTTFLNGRPVQKEWYLQNGDEIQLSVNGPKLGFIVPTGNKAKTGSIALSRRLSLFRQQALKPYRTAMWALAAILLLVICGSTWLGFHQKGQIEDLGGQNIALGEKLDLSERERKEAEARHAAELEAANKRTKELEAQVRNMKKDLKKALEEVQSGNVTVAATPHTSGTSNPKLSACEPHVYFVYIRRIDVTWDGEKRTIEDVGSGTGFLLSDGRFVTARHVVEPWMYPNGQDDDANLTMNAIAHSGGSVICYLEAYSPTGRKLSFTSSQAIINRKSDKTHIGDGFRLAFPEDRALDWAYFNTSNSGGLAFNNAKSQSLPVQEALTVLGYPMGLGANSPTDIHPIYSEAKVAREGLEHGCILTTATTFEHGNSGGPVFATTANGNLTVVGVVSAGAGRSTGVVVPICSVR